MDGPVLSGGVIVLVAVLLWALYFLPTWRGRHQYYAAERNAVRLNQALRVLAETSETPDEVRLELTARTALQQQRLAKRVQAQKESVELERLRQELAATRRDPLVRQARARRRVRASAGVVLAVGAALLGVGIWDLVAGGSWMLAVAGLAVAVLSTSVLVRMARVARHAERRTVDAPVVRTTERVSPPLHDQGPASWTPRPLPQPMVEVSGSRAQQARAQHDAQEERRRAERRAELRRRAEELAPPAPTPLAPVARAERMEQADAAESPYARMGVVDDAEIEAHVRELLARRAAG
ncbi:hypothetical protein Q9R19_13160 [Microbacterium sp. ARD32]|uniref:hypothetical protein n=1 Tax=Microbacterium sp. ARD32 TaxID=2962577 RepID=UPI0028816E2E|nr:hypothetical protein [Microbacterium sp. ARD32]MDT0158573.1 hypothetical protein [Microbacterium sp. ARD32]